MCGVGAREWFATTPTTVYSKIHSLRASGLTTRDAIVRGVEHTGGIITSAGLIMGVSFGAMMGSHTMSIQQIGFVLSAAVLVDTFVVRLFVIPAIMANLGEANWWPSYMAPPGQATTAVAGPLDLSSVTGHPQTKAGLVDKEVASVHTPLLTI